MDFQVYNNTKKKLFERELSMFFFFELLVSLARVTQFDITSFSRDISFAYSF